VIIPDAPGPDGSTALPSLPGMGPVAYFDGSSWEWWFDFNEEQLVELRRRMASRATRPGDRPFEPITDVDRQLLLFPPLAEALSHHDRDMRATAAMSLGRLGLASAVPLLIPMIDDPDLFVRTQSLIALGASGRLAALEPLHAVARNRRLSDELRVFAMAAVALIPGEEADGLLAGWLSPQWLENENNLIRAGAIFAAGVHESAGLLKPLLTLAQSNLCRREASMQALLAGALGRVPSEQAVPQLLSYSQGQDNQVRRSAAAGLQGQGQRLSPAQAQQVWQDMSHEGDWTIKLSLIKALAGSREPWMGDRLQHILKTTRTGALPHVALALGMNGNPDHVKALLKLLDQRHDTSLRSALAISLGLLGDPRAGPALSQLLNKTSSPQLQSGLCLAMGLVNAELPGQVETLATLTRKSHDVEVIRHGVMALGLLGARGTLDQFSESLPDIHSAVDLASMIHGLGLSGDLRQIQSLLTLLAVDEQPRFVLRYALGALGDLGDPRPVSPAGRYSRYANLELDMELLFELYRML
jgi:HEAT repeat protein